MNDLEIFRKRELKKVFGRYYLPFSWAEILLYLPFFILAIVVIPLLIYKEMWLFCLLVVLGFFFLTLLSFYMRLFMSIKTGLSLSENISIVKNISIRQKEFSKSLEVEGLYILSFRDDIPLIRQGFKNKIRDENLVIYCEEGCIYINSFSLSETCLIRTKNAQMLAKLIKLKVLRFR